MGARRWASVALLLVSVTACSEPFVAPTTLDECYRAIPDRDRGSGDVSPSWGIAYSEEDHALGTAGELYICVPEDFTATVTAEPLPGAEVDPRPLEVSAGSGAVPTLHVTVTEGDEENFHVILESAGESGTQWVVIEVDGDEWSFHSWR